ncbi:MAG: replicative DNA helicase, partial [Acidimicrobiales bacterium]
MTAFLDDPPSPRSSGAGSARVLPSNLQAEESLLGAMLLSRDAIAAASELLSADDFYKPAHGHIYDAITTLNAAGEPADPVTVADELRRAGLLEAIGGPATLVNLQVATPATSNAGRYAKIIEEHALLRRLIRVAGEIAEMGYDLPDDVTKTVDLAESMVFDVAQRRTTDTMDEIHNLLDANLDRLEQLYERGESITGVPTGFADLDELLSGMQPNALLVLGARPSAGKTALALGMATHAALEANRPVLLFSLEMSKLELTQRMLCSEARVDSKKVRNGNLAEADWQKIAHATGRLAEAPIWIDDNPNLTIMEIRSKARRLKARTGDLGLVVIDYLQLMTGRSSAENRQVEVSEISRGLKILARELECPVLALSQLSRGLEMRQDKRPMLADLRESGCLTADTRITRADTGNEVTLGDLLASGEQDVPIWTLNENYRLVRGQMTKVFPSGIKTVYELRLSSGRTVKASGNHPFL